MPRKLYTFDVGDSTKGPIGFVARIYAESEEEALEKLRRITPEEVELHKLMDPDDRGEVEYINVYLNLGNIHLKDIAEVEEAPDGA